MIHTLSPSAKFAVMYEFLSREDNLISVTSLCKIAGVSRAGYYFWFKSAKSCEVREEEPVPGVVEFGKEDEQPRGR
jgi:hypothetical protein